MKYKLVNVNSVPERSDLVSCQITLGDSSIGARCIDVSSANYDDILQLIACANAATTQMVPIRRETITRLDKDERCADFGGPSALPFCQK